MMDKKEKYYLLVSIFTDGESNIEFIKGQDKVRSIIINTIDQLDIEQSFVLVEDVPFGMEDGKPSVHQFLEWVAPYYNDNFNLDDYLFLKDQTAELEQKIEQANTDDIKVEQTIDTTQQKQVYDMLISDVPRKEIR